MMGEISIPVANTVYTYVLYVSHAHQLVFCTGHENVHPMKLFNLWTSVTETTECVIDTWVIDHYVDVLHDN